MTVNAEALARAVRARRQELGLLQHDIAARAGLNMSTISGIERGNFPHLRPTTLQALDRALSWEDGMSALLYSGVASVREAIRSFAGDAPKGDEYIDFLRTLATLTDEQIDEIGTLIESRRVLIAERKAQAL